MGEVGGLVGFWVMGKLGNLFSFFFLVGLLPKGNH